MRGNHCATSYTIPFFVFNCPIRSVPYSGTVNSNAIFILDLLPDAFKGCGNQTCMRVSLIVYFGVAFFPSTSTEIDLITSPSVNFALAQRPPVCVVVAEPRE